MVYCVTSVAMTIASSLAGSYGNQDDLVVYSSWFIGTAGVWLGLSLWDWHLPDASGEAPVLPPLACQVLRRGFAATVAATASALLLSPSHTPAPLCPSSASIATSWL